MEVVVRYRYDRKEGEEKREKRKGNKDGRRVGREEMMEAWREGNGEE